MIYHCHYYAISCHDAGVILCIHPANERWRYSVMPSLIAWAYTHNDPCDGLSYDQTQLHNLMEKKSSIQPDTGILDHTPPLCNPTWVILQTEGIYEVLLHNLWSHMQSSHLGALLLTHWGQGKMAAVSQSSRRDIQMHFLEWKSYNFDLNFMDVCFQCSHQQYSSIGSDNGLAPTRRQVIIWTNDG